MIQVTGILKTPMNEVSAKTLIRITSLDSSGECLGFLKSQIYTGADGSYDFQLLAGRYAIEVSFCNKYWLTGWVGTDSLTVTPIDLPTLLQDYAISADRPTPRVTVHKLYAGFSHSNVSTVIEPVISKGTSVTTERIHDTVIHLHRSTSDAEYMWVWVPDSLGSVRGFNFGADFVQPWVSVVVDIEGISGKLYISDNATHATDVEFKVVA